MINQDKYIKKHGCKPNGELQNWCFTLVRGVIRLHQYTDMITYEQAEKKILRQAKQWDAELIFLEP